VYSGIRALNGSPAVPLIQMSYYNGSSWTSDDPTVTGLQPHREYSMLVTPDSMVHFLLADTSATSCVVHIYKKIGSGAWRRDTVYNSGTRIATNTYQGHMETSLGLTKVANGTYSVWGFYTEMLVAGYPADLGLYVRKWNPTDSTWGNKVRVSAGDSVSFVTLSTPVPSNHGDRAYVSYSERIGTSSPRAWRLSLSQVLGDGNVTTTTTTTGTTDTTTTTPLDTTKSVIFTGKIDFSGRVIF